MNKPKYSEDLFVELIKQGYLRVEENGNVWRLADRRNSVRYRPIPITPAGVKNSAGYFIIFTMVNWESYACLNHRLIWTYFKGSIPANKEINHKNGIKTDNRLENLEVVTHSENCLHALRIGLLIPTRGEKTWSAKLTSNDIRNIRLCFENFETQREIALKFNISRRHVNRIINRKRWKHI